MLYCNLILAPGCLLSGKRNGPFRFQNRSLDLWQEREKERGKILEGCRFCRLIYCQTVRSKWMMKHRNRNWSQYKRKSLEFNYIAISGLCFSSNLLNTMGNKIWKNFIFAQLDISISFELMVYSRVCG